MIAARRGISSAGERGFTLVELVVSLGISVFLIGTVLMVQGTANRGFDGSLNEHRMTKLLRDGMGAVTVELRSALDSTIQVQPWNGVDGTPLLSFQNAVSFDVVNGATEWGAAGVIGATMEITILGTNLVRRVKDSNGDYLPDLERVLVRDLDFDTPNQVPALFAWDQANRTVGIDIHAAMEVGDRKIKRSVDTLIHIEDIYDF